MVATLSKWGNSLGLRIPKAFAKQIGLKEGMALELYLEGKKIILGRLSFSLEALLSKVSKSNLHGEIKTGKAVGREEWQCKKR